MLFWKKVTIFLLIIISISLVGCKRDDDNDDEINRKNIIPDELENCPMSELANGYKLVWCDEFEYQGAPNAKKWSYEIGTGNGGWGNNESQYYTNRLDNSYVSNGTLKIVAKKEAYSGSDYTSARLISKNKGDFKYGFIEIRAKLPEGRGTWPALWMMPTTSEYGGWPNSGEIDIMEAVGRNPNSILGTLHTGSNHGGNGRGRTIPLANTATTYNLYQMEWTEDYIQFLTNGSPYFKLEYNELWKNSNSGYMYWPFDQEFFLIMNVAMGGTLGGSIDSSFIESQMEIDYVRVYEKHTEDDNEIPSTPELSNYFSTSTTINLEWDDVQDNVGVRHYEIILNNEHVASTINNNYIINNLLPDTTYRIQVLAVDWKNNYSVSNKYVITTTGVLNIPGNVLGTSFSSVVGASVTDGNATESSKVLRIKGNANVEYIINCQTNSNYRILFRASVLKQTNIRLYLINQDQQKLEIISTTIDATYGKYSDIVLGESISILSGQYKLLIETSGTDIDSILLNYIRIEKD